MHYANCKTKTIDNCLRTWRNSTKTT